MDKPDDMLWNGSEEDGNVRSKREEGEMSVDMETVTLIGKGRQNLTCFVYQVYEIYSKILHL
jgi:hypothetical protein